MATVFFTSDTHFLHARIADIRGFGSAAEHDEVLVEKWNAVVGRHDQVWHLGDVTIKDHDTVAPILARLNGTKHLIAGNHDTCWPGHRRAHTTQAGWLGSFASVQPFACRDLDGRRVLLSHFPYQQQGDHTEAERYTQYRLPDTGLWLLHGHVHDAWRVRARQINVGVDRWDFAPVEINALRDVMRDSDAAATELAARGW